MIVCTCQLALGELGVADHPSTCSDLAGKYLILFSLHKNNGAELGEDVLDELSTRFPKE